MLRRLLVAAALLALTGPATAADPFDYYTNAILSRAVNDGALKELPAVTPEVIADAGRVLPTTTAAFLVVRTNEGRLSKLLVQAARQKVPGDAGEQIPMLQIERYVTYKEGTERAVQATGRDVNVYSGMQFSLDLGQVVPTKLGGDLAVAEPFAVKPVGRAKVYLVEKPLPAAAPPAKPAKLEVGEAFEVRYFNGTYKLYDDGRRSGELTLKVTDDGEATGTYTSDKDGQQYEVKGHVGNPRHSITFTVKYPRTEQVFTGMLFTGNGHAIAGTSKLQDRETGFYAVREEN
jgi:hypothetical protein